MKLIYDGPLLEVEVPHDDVSGGLIVAERGKVVEVPDAVAKGLLDQGNEHVVGDGGKVTVVEHAGPWRKATARQEAAATPTEAPKGGEQS
jgi:hypothetical protein